MRGVHSSGGGQPSRDRDLARRMLAGEEAAFEEFFGRYFPALYRFALARLARDPDAAEEIAQATLCKAIAKLSTYRGEAVLFSWLCTFCRHEISAFLLRRKKRAAEVDLIEDTAEVNAALASLASVLASDPESSARRREIARRVQMVLDHLPEQYGNILEWKYIEGRSVKEIAARLGSSAKAAESKLTRAREAFRDGFLSLVDGGPETVPGTVPS